MKDFKTITERPGQKASTEQLKRLYHRYKFASTLCNGKDVLDVACGSGLGLGYIEKIAKEVVGGDIDENNLHLAKYHYRGRKNIGLVALDGHQLPFRDSSFDVVVIFESIYYLAQPEKCLDESYRILRDRGIVLICTVNKDWSEFNPSPYSTKYFSVPELYQLIKRIFPIVDLYGSFSTSPNSARDKITALIKRIAVALHLMPRTMRGKELFKRIFFGKLIPLPNEIKTGMCEYAPAVPIACDSINRQFKVIYALGQVG